MEVNAARKKNTVFANDEGKLCPEIEKTLTCKCIPSILSTLLLIQIKRGKNIVTLVSKILTFIPSHFICVVIKTKYFYYE